MIPGERKSLTRTRSLMSGNRLCYEFLKETMILAEKKLRLGMVILNLRSTKGRQGLILHQGMNHVITLVSLLGFLKKRELPVYRRCREMLRCMRSKDGKELRRQRKRTLRKLFMLARLVVGIFWMLLKEVFMVLGREEAPQLKKVFVAEHIIRREQKRQKAMLFGDKMLEKVNYSSC